MKMHNMTGVTHDPNHNKLVQIAKIPNTKQKNETAMCKKISITQPSNTRFDQTLIPSSTKSDLTLIGCCTNTQTKWGGWKDQLPQPSSLPLHKWMNFKINKN